MTNSLYLVWAELCSVALSSTGLGILLPLSMLIRKLATVHTPIQTLIILDEVIPYSHKLATLYTAPDCIIPHYIQIK